MPRDIDTGRAIGAKPQVPNFVERNAPRPVPGKVFHGGIPRTPFHPVSKQEVHHAPIIPRVKNPTPEQTHAALQMAHRYQTAQIGHHPTAQKVKAYQRSLANDPNARDFLQSVAHYNQAAQKVLEGAKGVRGGTATAGSFLSPSERNPHVQAIARLLHTSGVADVGSVAQKAEAEREPLNFSVRHGFPARPITSKELKAATATEAAREERQHPRTEGGNPIGTIVSNLAPGIAAIEKKGWENLAGKNIGSVIGGIGGDVAQIGAFPFVSAYQLGEASGKLAKGDTSGYTKLAKQLGEGVSSGAIGHIAKGDIPGALNQLREHALLSVLELEGARAVGGRAAGGLARAVGKPGGGLRGAAHELGSTTLDPRALSSNPNLAHTFRIQGGSKDLIRNLIQRQVQKIGHPVLKDEHGNPIMANVRGKQRPVRSPGSKAEKLQQRRANFEFFKGQTQGRNEQIRAARAVKKGQRPLSAIRSIEGVKGKFANKVELGEAGTKLISRQNIDRHLHTLVAEGRLARKTFKEDIAREIAHAKAALKRGGTPLERRAAEHNLGILQKARDISPKRQRAVVNAGQRVGKVLNKYDRELAGQAQIEPERANRARLRVTAEARLGARHFTEEDFKKAEALASTKAEKIAVSGRDVVGTHLHETALHEHGISTAVHDAAVKRVQRATLKVRDQARLVRHKRAVGTITRADENELHSRRENLKLATAARNEATKGKNTSAALVRAHPLPDRVEGLRAASGRAISNAEVEAHLKGIGHDPETVAKISHHLEGGELGYQAEATHRPSVSSKRSTGHLYQQAATDIGPHAVLKEAERKVRMRVRAKAWDSFIKDNGIRHPAAYKTGGTKKDQAIRDRGGMFTRPEAAKALREHNEGVSARLGDPGERLVAVSAYPAKESAPLQVEIRGKQVLGDTLYGSLDERLVDLGSNTKARNVALVSEAQLQRWVDHQTDPGHAEKLFQMAMVPFRMAVLPQPKWLAGNFIEPFFIRLPAYGSGAFLPGLAVDYHAFRKGMKILRNGTEEQKALAKDLDAQYGGLLIGSRTATTPHHYGEPGLKGKGLLYRMHQVRNAPVLRPMQDMLISAPKMIFELNRVMETTLQQVAVGHQIRGEIQEATGSWNKGLVAAKGALADVMNGLENTAQQERFFNVTNEMLGKYNGWGPATKKMVTAYTPFIPWMLNAFRFVYWTLPTKHTIKFNLLMKSAAPMMAQWEAEHAGVPPGELEAAPKVGPNKYVNLGKFTPYGATLPYALMVKSALEGKSGEKYTGALANILQQFVPQVSGAGEAARGNDPFGNPLQVKPTPDKPKGEAGLVDILGIMAKDIGTSVVPAGGTLMRLTEGKGTPYANSYPWSRKKKPETGGSAVSRALNPFRPTELAEHGKHKGKGLGGGLGKTKLGGGLGKVKLGGGLK